MLRQAGVPPSLAPLAAGVALAIGLAAPPARAGERWSWPVNGAVITPYRNGSDPYAGGQHRGIDVAAGVGAPVLAATGGTVRFAAVAGSSGLTVSVRTGDGRFDTSYLHLSRLDVREGERVAARARLGAVGTSGRRSAPAPHLHFGVREAGSRHAYLDPLDFLPPPAPPARDRPRGGPAPVFAPVRVVPEPVPSPLPLMAPRRAPARIRVPAGRRVRGPVRSPRPRIARPALEPLPLGAPARAVARREAPRRLGRPARVPLAGPAASSAPAAQPAPAAGRLAPAGGDSRASGPSLGWAIACAGLLLAAACLGRPEQARQRAGDARGRVSSLLRPLLGRR